MTTAEITRILESDLFSGKNSRKAVIKNQQERGYANFPVHLFPAHPKAPYMNDEGLFSRCGLNAEYTANFLMDIGRKNGCPQESKTDRMYIALMARAKVMLENDPKTLDEAIMVIEGAVVPDIASRYGWDEEYVRKGLLPACVNAMAEGFKAENGILLKLYNAFLESCQKGCRN